MMCFPSMLIRDANRAGMPVPPDPDEFVNIEYPHFAVFCAIQLNRCMADWDEPEFNAKVIMQFSKEEIKTKSLADLIAAGLRHPNPISQLWDTHRV